MPAERVNLGDGIEAICGTVAEVLDAITGSPDREVIKEMNDLRKRRTENFRKLLNDPQSKFDLFNLIESINITVEQFQEVADNNKQSIDDMFSELIMHNMMVCVDVLIQRITSYGNIPADMLIEMFALIYHMLKGNIDLIRTDRPKTIFQFAQDAIYAVTMLSSNNLGETSETIKQLNELKKLIEMNINILKDSLTERKD